MSVPATAADAARVVVTLGNPNAGKSTLFNRLTGLRQKTGNFPGVTVEHVSGSATLGGTMVNLVDVPGTYSLAAASPDEMIAVDVLQGNVDGLPRPAAVIAVIDASNLRRNLFLLSQVLEAGLPVIVALNMMDRLPACGITIDVDQLAARLGVPVVPVVASTGEGMVALGNAVAAQIEAPVTPHHVINRELDDAVATLVADFADSGVETPALLVRRALVDEDGYAEQRVRALGGERASDRLRRAREALAPGRKLAAVEARDRYGWIQDVVSASETRVPAAGPSLSDRIDAVVNHPVAGTLLFALVMAAVFQAVFAWAAPLVDAIDYLSSALAGRVADVAGDGVLGSFLADGVIAGVGSVIVFLPQIIILFIFIILLEDTGYMARAAFLMDRVMRSLGLSGQAFIPMLSSFACAVPGIMGTRIIANSRDRLATIMAAPFMTCSARLPVYSLLIAGFVPDTRYLGGVINLQGLLLFGLYVLGIVGGGVTAWIIGRLFRRGARSRFLMEMPPYRAPMLRALLARLASRVLIFLRRAGTIIFAVALIVWALAYFPVQHDSEGAVASNVSESYLGRASRSVSPLFAPLGWDWRVTASVLASFPAREIVIAAMGTIYAVDTEAEGGATTLTRRIRAATHADGSPVFTVPMVMGLLVFYAFCLQCVSTIAVMRRETDTWRWPLAAWIYMTTLGYVGAFVVFRVGTLLQA